MNAANNSGVLRIMPPTAGSQLAANAGGVLSAAAVAAAQGTGPKGLRYYSNRVMVKVRELGVTTYQDVADMLVREYLQEQNVFVDPSLVRDAKLQDEARNIRRRVYDALNVLIAMNIVRKERKNIEFVGLPVSADEQKRELVDKANETIRRINKKRAQLRELLIQLVAYKSLVERNRSSERTAGPPPADSVVHLPYIVVTTDASTKIECQANDDGTEYLFTLDRPFEIHDDIEVLKRLDMARGLDKLGSGDGGPLEPDDVRDIKACVPPQLHHYVDKLIADGDLTETSDVLAAENELRRRAAANANSATAAQQQHVSTADQHNSSTASSSASGAQQPAVPHYQTPAQQQYRPVVVRRGVGVLAGRPLAPAVMRSARTSPYTVPPRSNMKVVQGSGGGSVPQVGKGPQ